MGPPDDRARRRPVAAGAMTPPWFVALWACLWASSAQASGFFELQVLGIENPRGELLDGSCCGARCPGLCNTYFRLCLKEYQASVDLTGQCTFGNLTSPLIGGSTFSVKTHPDKLLLLRLPFHFRWTVSAPEPSIGLLKYAAFSADHRHLGGDGDRRRGLDACLAETEGRNAEPAEGHARRNFQGRPACSRFAPWPRDQARLTAPARPRRQPQFTAHVRFAVRRGAQVGHRRDRLEAAYLGRPSAATCRVFGAVRGGGLAEKPVCRLPALPCGQPTGPKGTKAPPLPSDNRIPLLSGERFQSSLKTSIYACILTRHSRELSCYRCYFKCAGGVRSSGYRSNATDAFQRNPCCRGARRPFENPVRVRPGGGSPIPQSKLGLACSWDPANERLTDSP